MLLCRAHLSRVGGIGGWNLGSLPCHSPSRPSIRWQIPVKPLVSSAGRHPCPKRPKPSLPSSLVHPHTEHRDRSTPTGAAGRPSPNTPPPLPRARQIPNDPLRQRPLAVGNSRTLPPHPLPPSCPLALGSARSKQRTLPPPKARAQKRRFASESRASISITGPAASVHHPVIIPPGPRAGCCRLASSLPLVSLRGRSSVHCRSFVWTGGDWRGDVRNVDTPPRPRPSHRQRAAGRRAGVKRACHFATPTPLSCLIVNSFLLLITSHRLTVSRIHLPRFNAPSDRSPVTLSRLE